MGGKWKYYDNEARVLKGRGLLYALAIAKEYLCSVYISSACKVKVKVHYGKTGTVYVAGYKQMAI